MKIAFSRPTRAAEELEVLLAKFSSVGYDGLQLKGNQYPAEVEDAKRLLQSGRYPSGAASGLICGAALDEPGCQRIRQVLRVAAVLKSERVIFCHSHVREGVTPQQLREFARILSDLALEARQLGTRLSLHHHFKQPVMYRADFDLFFAAADPALGLTLDTAHAVLSGITDLAGLIGAMGQRIDNVHLKDLSGSDFKMLGQGQIDFAPVFEALAKIGYSGWLAADEESGGEMLSGMRASLQFIRSGISLQSREK